MLAIGIDSGTQSTRSIVFDDETGVVLADAQRKYGLIKGLPKGHLEQDPETWRDAVEETVAECVEKVKGRRDEIRAIGVSGQQHGLVVLDENGDSVRPAKLWCDTSTTAQCDAIHRHFGGPKKLIELAGNPILPGYTAPKLLWLKENEPEHFDATRSVLLPHDYLNYFLTGEMRMEHGDASGTALLDVRKRRWCGPLMEFIDPKLKERFPVLGSSREPAGLLRSKLAKAWGLGSQVVVSAGGGDNMMGAIGTGNIAPGVMTASLGTSGTLYGFSEEPRIDPEGEAAAFCDSTGHWLPLVCTMNVTVASEAVRSCFQWSLKELETHLESAEPGAGGLVFLPYLQGERTPSLPKGCGVLHGITADNLTPANLARAAVEGATLGLAYGLSRFSAMGMKPNEIRVTGGGSRSRVWRQMVADAFGCPVVGLKTGEGAALGAALQAAWCWHETEGEGCQLQELTERCVVPDEKQRCYPVPRQHALYADLLQKQTDLTRNLHRAGYL